MLVKVLDTLRNGLGETHLASYVRPAVTARRHQLGSDLSALEKHVHDRPEAFG